MSHIYVLFISHNLCNTICWVLLLLPFYREENEDLERLNNCKFLKMTHKWQKLNFSPLYDSEHLKITII